MSDDDHNGQDGFGLDMPESLLPYDTWMEDAYRDVMLRAIEHAATEGLPGDHHFYLTFRTDRDDTIIPARLKAQYPEEMTIVLQHQYRDLTVDRDVQTVSVVLSFGGVSSTLVIPVSAITAFADPYVHMAMRFTTSAPQPAEAEEIAPPEPASSAETSPEEDRKEAEVVSLAAFRKRPTP